MWIHSAVCDVSLLFSVSLYRNSLLEISPPSFVLMTSQLTHTNTLTRDALRGWMASRLRRPVKQLIHLVSMVTIKTCCRAFCCRLVCKEKKSQLLSFFCPNRRVLIWWERKFQKLTVTQKQCRVGKAETKWSWMWEKLKHICIICIIQYSNSVHVIEHLTNKVVKNAAQS